MSFQRRFPAVPLAYSLEPEAIFNTGDDVITVKSALAKLGYYELRGKPLSPVADHEMWEAIEAFQTDRGLHVDGTIRPNGETAEEIGQLLPNSIPTAQRRRRRPKPFPNDPCDHLYWKVDIPTCKGIRRRRGPAAAARCYHSATERYGACLHGTPMDQLPPLDTTVW